MKTKTVRCYRALAPGARGRLEEVLFMLPDFGYDVRLYSCLSCGERFVADTEAEHHFGKSLDSRIAAARCPSCNSPLKKTLRPYPQVFRAADGSVRRFELPRLYPPDADTVVAEFWDLDSIASRAGK